MFRRNVVKIIGWIVMVLSLLACVGILMAPVSPLFVLIPFATFIGGQVMAFARRNRRTEDEEEEEAPRRVIPWFSILLWVLVALAMLVVILAIVCDNWFWFFVGLVGLIVVLAIWAFARHNVVAVIAFAVAVAVLFFSIIFCGMDIIAGNRGNVVDGDLIVNGDVILEQGDVNVGGDANVEGDANIGGNANVEGDVNVDGDINVTEPPATEPPATEPPATEPPHKHSYSSKVTKEATCINDGVRTYTCTCGKSYTENIAKLGHSYTSKVVAPTTEAKGYTLYTCSKCGDSYKDDYTDKLVTPAINCANTIRYGETVYVYLEGIEASNIKVSNKLFVEVEIISDNRVAVTLTEDVTGYITITDTVSGVNVVIDIAE